jgi:hypothetical protein
MAKTFGVGFEPAILVFTQPLGLDSNNYDNFGHGLFQRKFCMIKARNHEMLKFSAGPSSCLIATYMYITHPI